MTDTPQNSSSAASRDVLAGLARIHPFVLLADRRGRVAWVSEKLREQISAGCPSGSARLEGDGVGLLRDFLASLPKPEQLEALRSELRRSQHAQHMRVDLRGPDGGMTAVEVNAFQVEIEEPGDPHFVVIARPLGDRKRAEEGLHGTVDLLSSVLDSAPDGVIATDRSGFITYTNPAITTFLGAAPETLIGKPIALFLPAAEGFNEVLERLSKSAGWSGEEIEKVDPAGRSTWTSVSTRPLRLGNGRSVGSVTFLRDITRRRRVEAELMRKNAELESYVDAVAHDLRSPLVSILGFTRLLRQDYEQVLDQTGHHFIDRVEQAGRTMEALIHDLLELSRIRGAEGPRPLADPHRVLSQLSAELKLRLEEQSVDLILPMTPPMMQIESTRLYQIFSNLIGNALKHMGPCESPRIRVEIREHDHQHTIVVADNGCGIPAEDHERIFEAFQTGRPTSRARHRSSGIGLAIVKKIAETHGGGVQLESGPGAGARFYVTLPAP